MNDVTKTMTEMSAYYAGQPHRINHFIKVYGFAKFIGEAEGIGADIQHIVELAALTHDIGIKPSEEKYGDCNGKHQELEGPPKAMALFNKVGIDKKIAERVCFIIGKHHTYGENLGVDHQIIIEADFLVNAFEENMTCEQIANVKRTIFKTNTGKVLLKNLFGDN